jgi:copper transport protein
MSSPSEAARRVGLRVAGALFALGLLLGPAASPALGHALLLRADPPDGSVLAAAPDRVRLVFTQAVAVGLSKVELVDSAGRTVTLDGLAGDPADPTVMVIDPPALSADAYRLSWRVVSNDDLHPSIGTLVFGVGVTSSVAVPAGSAVSALASLPETVDRWLDLLALSVLVGAVALLYLGVPQMAASDVRGPLQAAAEARRRFARLAIAAGSLSLVTGAVLLGLQAGAAGATIDADLVRYLQTGFAEDLIVRTVLIVALVGLTAWATRIPGRRPTGIQAAASLGLVGALSLAEAGTTHLASLIAFPLGLIVGSIHLLAAGLWVGGLVALVVTVLPHAQRDPDGRSMALRIVRRFGVMAAVSGAGLGVTGLFVTGQLVATVDALLFSSYGQLLLIKILLVGVVALIGLSNAISTQPRLQRLVVDRLPGRLAGRLGPRSPSRSIAAEMVAAVAVLGVVALLGVTPPARGPEYDPIPDSARITTVTAQADDLLVLLSVRPNRPGRNFVTVGIHDTRRPAPAPIGTVRVRLVAPDGTEVDSGTVARPIGDGRYELAGDAITADGAWTIGLTVDRPGLPTASLTTPWTVVPAGVPVAARRVVVSNQPLAPILTAVALMGGFLLAAVLAIAGYRRARFPAIPEPARGPSPAGTLDGWPG